MVLLILAGITISAITGSENVMKKATEAREKNEIGAIKDEVNLIIVNHELSSSTLEQDLKDKFGENSVTKPANVNDTYYIEKNGHTFTVYDDGEVVEGTVSVWSGLTAEAQVPTNKDDTNKIIHIYNCDEFKWLQETVSGGNDLYGYTIYLEKDLDLGARESNGNWNTSANENVQWTPIGAPSSTLRASFEGQNHTIRGVYSEGNEGFGGLFARFSGTLKNLTLKDSYIKNTNYVGGLVGVLIVEGKVYNCHNVNTIVDATGYYSGGIVGQANGQIDSCTNNGEILGKYIGGIVGLLYKSQIKNCTNNGKIMGYYIAGIAGYAYSSTSINECTNNGNVSGTGYAGGITSVLYDNAKIINCTNNGKISSSTNSVGGITGSTNSGSQLSSCTNNGNITGSERVGGIIGNASSGSQLSSCTNNGNVNGTIGVAGIVGVGSSILSDCTNTGNITGSENVGGITGDCIKAVKQDISYCFNSGKITGNGTDVGGISGYLGAQGYNATLSYCYNKGEVINNSETTGAIVGHMARDATITSCYYINTITLPGVGTINAGGTSTIEEQRANTTPTGETINSLQEFKNKLSDGMPN